MKKTLEWKLTPKTTTLIFQRGTSEAKTATVRETKNGATLTITNDSAKEFPGLLSPIAERGRFDSMAAAVRHARIFLGIDAVPSWSSPGSPSIGTRSRSRRWRLTS